MSVLADTLEQRKRTMTLVAGIAHKLMQCHTLEQVIYVLEEERRFILEVHMDRRKSARDRVMPSFFSKLP